MASMMNEAAYECIASCFSPSKCSTRDSASSSWAPVGYAKTASSSLMASCVVPIRSGSSCSGAYKIYALSHPFRLSARRQSWIELLVYQTSNLGNKTLPNVVFRDRATRVLFLAESATCRQSMDRSSALKESWDGSSRKRSGGMLFLRVPCSPPFAAPVDILECLYEHRVCETASRCFPLKSEAGSFEERSNVQKSTRATQPRVWPNT